MSERYKSVNQVSEMTGIDRRTIKKKIAGIPIYSKQGRAELYDMFEVLPKLWTKGNEKDIEAQLISEQLRYEQARADKMILEVEQRRGEVVPVSEVAAIVANEYANVRARILSIPSRCAKDLSLESNPSMVKERLEQEVHEALAELSAEEKFEENPHVDESSSNPETDATEDSQASTEIKPS